MFNLLLVCGYTAREDLCNVAQLLLHLTLIWGKEAFCLEELLSLGVFYWPVHNTANPILPPPVLSLQEVNDFLPVFDTGRAGLT